MKIKTLSILITLFLIACSTGNKKIKLIQNYDSIYLSENRVKTQAKPIDKEFTQHLNNDVKEIIKKVYNKNINKPEIFPTEIFPIGLRIYINENGYVEMVKDIPVNTKLFHGETIYPNVKKITKLLLPKIENWKFTAATLNGKQVKARKDLKAIYVINNKGNIKIKMPFQVKTTNNNYSDYFISVQEMPRPIGGVAGIQKKIVYPELAKKAGLEGRVFVRAYIDENGNVVHSEILKSAGSILDSAALKAVEETKFIPGKQNGKPVKVQVVVPIMFRLN